MTSSFKYASALILVSSLGFSQALSAKAPPSAQDTALEQAKMSLEKNIEAAIQTCKCLANLIDRKEALFPETSKKEGIFSKLSSKKSNTPSITREQYIDFIANMRINAGVEQTRIKKVVSTWPNSKNSPDDVKELNVKVSMELRAMSSFCSQPFRAIKAVIEKLSPSTKIDATQCTLGANAKN